MAVLRIKRGGEEGNGRHPDPGKGGGSMTTLERLSQIHSLTVALRDRIEDPEIDLLLKRIQEAIEFEKLILEIF